MKRSLSTSPFSHHNSPLALQNHSDGNKTKQSQVAPSIQKKYIVELQTRDREVRNHQQAHVTASGGLVKVGPAFPFNEGLMENSMLSEEKLVLRLRLTLSQVIHKPPYKKPRKFGR